jgi:hypothetical protein
MKTTPTHISTGNDSAPEESRDQAIRRARERRYQRAIEGWLASRLRARGRHYRRVVISGPTGGPAPT